MVFKQLSTKMQNVIEKRFKEPTLPQKLAIPYIASGLNVMVIAPTGSGKTESAMLKIFDRIVQEKPKPINTLYITPMKSLNRDMLDRIMWWSKELDIEVAVRHGDTPPAERKGQIDFPPDIMITTLEQLQPMLSGKNVRELLRNVKHIIVDECLPYDALVALEDDSKIKIGKLVEENLKSKDRDIYVKTLDIKTGNITSSKVTKFHKIPVRTKMVSIITKHYKTYLAATENHPILVSRKNKIAWINASDIVQGDKLLIHVTEPNANQQIEENRGIFLDANKFRGVYNSLFYTGGRGQVGKLEKSIKRLEKWGLLPLTYKDNKARILARLMGHIFGDGWLTITDSTVSTGFSAKLLDLELIRSELKGLGFALHNTITRETNSTFTDAEGSQHNIRGTTNSTANGSKTLAAMIKALGAPNGEKTDTKYSIPEWILNSPKDVKREFLSSYLGAELSTPSGRPYLDFDAPRISIYKREDIIGDGLKLAGQFKKLFEEFGIVVSDISIGDGNTRKDGTRSKKTVITFSNKEENLIRLNDLIGISYCEEKRIEFNLIRDYLMAKQLARENKLMLVNKIKELKRKGLSDSSIGKMLGFDKKHGKRQTDYIRRLAESTGRIMKGFPSFIKWRGTIVGDCVTDEVDYVGVYDGKDKFVYDISVENTHNFIANDIVVHNCHEVVDSKRGVQLTIALERIRELCGDFQLIMLSATVADPEHVAEFFSGGKLTKVVQADTGKEFDIRVINPRPTIQDEKISEKISSSKDTAARLRTIMDLIKDSKATLTFTNTRDFAEILSSRIRVVDKDFPVAIHHGSLSKDVRIKAEKDFKEGRIKSLISTSSLQLGIDIGDIDLTIQYMSPRQVSQLVQRVGRSGHDLSKISKGILITTDEDDIFESAVIARKALAGEIENLVFHENTYDVLAHQLIGLTFDFGRIELEKAYNIIKRAYPYRNLTYEEFMDVCRQLERLGLAFVDGYIKKRIRGFQYYFENLSTIPNIRQYRVFNMLDHSFVGVLDEEFVAIHGQENTTFIVKGRPWRIVTVDGDKVMVEPIEDIEAAIPGWEGELIPVLYDVTQEVGKLRGMIASRLDKISQKELIAELQKKYPVDENSAKEMVETIKKQVKSSIVPDDKTILVEDYENLVIIHTCYGNNINETLGRFIVALLTSRVGSVGLKTDPYRIMIQFQKKNIDLLKEVLFNTKPEHLRSYLEMSLANSELFAWKFVHVAKRFGAITRDADFGKVRMKRIIDDYVGTPIFKETMKELETEKFDIQKATELLEKIQKKEIKVIFRNGLSHLGKIGAEDRYAEVVAPEKPEMEIFELFKQRLLNTQLRLVCVNCGNWDQLYTVKEINDKIICGKCESKLLAPLKKQWVGAGKIVKKAFRKLPMDDTDKKRYENMKKRAELFMYFKSKAAKTMAGRGVGPTTAKRILGRYHKNDDSLFRDVLESEKLFAKNKRFWKI